MTQGVLYPEQDLLVIKENPGYGLYHHLYVKAPTVLVYSDLL